MAATELTQILYEIAMNIGIGMDRQAMLKRSIQTMARRLSCLGGVVFASRQDGEPRKWEEVFAVPRNIRRSLEYSEAIDRLVSAAGGLAAPVECLPPITTSGGDVYFHRLVLPGYGILILLKSSPLDTRIMLSLRQICIKLGVACVACENAEALARSREILRDNELRLKLAANAARMGVWDWDIVGNRLIWDERMFELYGIRSKSVAFGVEMWENGLHPEDKMSAWEACQAALRGEREYDVEFRVKHPDGAVRHIKANGIVIRNEAGSPIRMLGVNYDITEQKRAEEEVRALNIDLEARVRDRTAELVALNKELESFGYSLSHDLRAPLRAVNGFSQILQEDYSACLDDTGKDYLKRIQSAASRMGQLIDDMLKLSRISRALLNRVPVDLREMALGILGELKDREPGRCVEVRVAEPLIAHADPNLIRIVLENLLGNAWKFSSRKSESRIEVGRLPPTSPQEPPTFFVRDNGVGFNMAYSDKLFKAFQRLHGQEEFPGTGIGLATVARIIHLHGGEIRAEGKEGQGAIFLFTLAPGTGSISDKKAI